MIAATSPINPLNYLIPQRGFPTGLGDDSGDVDPLTGDLLSDEDAPIAYQDSSLDSTNFNVGAIGPLPTTSATATYAAETPILDEAPTTATYAPSNTPGLELTSSQLLQVAAQGAQMGLQASGATTPTPAAPATVAAPATPSSLTSLENWLGDYTLISSMTNAEALALGVGGLFALVAVTSMVGGKSTGKRKR